MFGGKNDLLVPALIGLGIFAQNSEMNLANNTSILLILFLLLKECKTECHHDDHHDGYYPDGIIALRGRGLGRYPNDCPLLACAPELDCKRAIRAASCGCGCDCHDDCHKHHHCGRRRRRERERPEPELYF